MDPIRDLHIDVAVLPEEQVLVVWHHVPVVESQAVFLKSLTVVLTAVIGVCILY
jgi:hypothetical protein